MNESLAAIAESTITKSTGRKIVSSGRFQNLTSSPPKYDAVYHPSPEEIPKLTSYNLFKAMDQDFDDRISLNELRAFTRSKNLNTITEEQIQEMFSEASSHRAIVHQKQKGEGLTLEELIATVRGRVSYGAKPGQHKIVYRKCRPLWILLYRTISKDIFTKAGESSFTSNIRAQYEEDIKPDPLSLTQNYGRTLTKISEIPPKMKFNQTERHEAGVNPNTIKKMKIVDNRAKPEPYFNPYEQAVNSKIREIGLKYPKITFESQEYYNESKRLSQMPTYWGDEHENPIFKYIPEKVRAITLSPDDFKDVKSLQLPSQLKGKHLSKSLPREIFDPDKKVFSATISNLPQYEMDAIEKEREKKLGKKKQGKTSLFQTTFKIEDCNEAKMRITQENPIEDPYINPRDHKFRDDLPPLDKPEFKDKLKCPGAYNPLGISEHDRRPKDVLMRIVRERERAEEHRRREYSELFTGKQTRQRDWQGFIKLSSQTQEMGSGHNHLLFAREQYIEPLELLGKQMREDLLPPGNPIFHLHSKTLKANDLNIELGGIHKPFKVLH